MDVLSVFKLAKDETFTDGMDSNFSIEMTKLIKNGTPIQMIQKLMHDIKHDKHGICAEIPRIMGNMDDEKTHDIRKKFLLDELKSSDSIIRDAAAIGLEALDDISTKPYIDKAILMETNQFIKNHLCMISKNLYSFK